MRKLLRKLRYWLNRRQADRDLQDEMAAHREMLAEEGRAAAFGSPLRLREESRDVWGLVWLEQILLDIRHAFRTLRRTPVFTASALAILALGMGVNLTLFDLVNAALLRPLPVPHPETLVQLNLWARDGEGGAMTDSGFPLQLAQKATDHDPRFQSVLFRGQQDLAWDDGSTDPVRAYFVSPGWFGETAVTGPQLGRWLMPEDASAGSARVVVLSQRLWRTRLGADPAIAGKTVRLQGVLATVAGIAPASYAMEGDVWAPLEQADAYGSPLRGVDTFARVETGASPIPLRPETVRGFSNWDAGNWRSVWFEPYPATNGFTPPRELQDRWRAVAIIGGLTLVVLLVACANLGNLILSRAVGRLRELSVRAALGASRIRVVRQILTECLLLGLAGAAAGTLLAYGGANVLLALADLPPFLVVSPDANVLLAGFALAVFVMLAIGGIPAWRVCRKDLTAFLKDGNQQASASLHRTHLRQWLVAVQVAGSCLLVIVAGLMASSLREILTRGPGFDVHGVAAVDPKLYRLGMKPAEIESYRRRLAEAVAALPGVERIAFSSIPPLGQAWNESVSKEVPGLRRVRMQVEPEFFPLLQIPILVGHAFRRDDPPDAMIVSRKIAMQKFGTLDVIGKTLLQRTIVGVAGDANITHFQQPDLTEEYQPLDLARAGPSASLLIRYRPGAHIDAAALRRAARDTDSRVFAGVQTIEANFNRKLAPIRLSSNLGMAIATLALVLAGLGLFSVVAYAATLRTKEIGIRMALGAAKSSLVLTLARQITLPLILGIALGTAATWKTASLLTGPPLRLPAMGWMVPAAAILTVIAAAAAAALIPAWRALRRDPLEALRHE